MGKIYLDEFGDAEVPDDCVLVDSEADFLHLATSRTSLLIRGEKLCRWAEQFYFGRGVLFSRAVSPTRQLVSRYPWMKNEEAVSVREMMDTPPETWEPLDILNAIFPNEFWSQQVSKRHCAEYLLWLSGNELPPFLSSIRRSISEDWANNGGVYSKAYSVADRLAATELLHKWIQANDIEIIQSLGRYPLPVVGKWKQARSEYWTKEIIQRYGQFMLDFLRIESEFAEKQEVAEESLKYFRANPSALTNELAVSIKPYLSEIQLDELSDLLPLPEPSAVPTDLPNVAKWFEREYLPYRARALSKNDGLALNTSVIRAEEFAAWFLEHFHGNLSEGKFFTQNRTANLRSQKDTINLVLLLDGLNRLDADLLVTKLFEQVGNDQLKLIEDSFSVSMLPTVTEFTKKHILTGGLVFDPEASDMIGVDLADKRSPKELINTAEMGQTIFWRLKEPDNTYHREGDSADLRSRIEAVLYGVALQVSRLLDEVSSLTPLRVIITTDHGRLLGVSKRTLEPPAGFTAHGRAAWGNMDVDLGGKGYKIDGKVAYLSQETFLLEPKVAAVSISEEAFSYNRYSEEVSPHGGVFPEEVILPWIVFERAVERPRFKVSVSGSAEANKPGNVTVSVINPSEYVAELRQASFDFGALRQKFETNLRIEAKDTNEFSFTLDNWPSADQKDSGSGLVVIALPNGELLECGFETKELGSRSMYKRGNILDGLDL